MSSAKFTLIGCYQFFNNAGDDLFKNLLLPEGIDKDTLTTHILLQGGEFEVQHANPFFIQGAIGAWSNVWQDTMTRWVNALAIDYAPLENYDRHENWTDTTDSETNATNVGTLDTSTRDVTDRSVETKKSAFDSSTYQPEEYVDEDITETGTIDTDTRNTIDSTDSAESVHAGRIHGNIGVTTSQQMLTQELDLGYWNLYQRITQLFLQEFVIPVYE